jgi:copper(I)-binding protein
MPSSRRCSRSGAGAAALLTLVAVVAAAILSGCSASPSGLGTGAVPVISNAWIRPSTAVTLPAAGYLTITNPGPQADALTSVSSPATTSVELHETSTISGMTGMHSEARLEIPAGGSVKLEPGGNHLMLMGVTGNLTVGSIVELVLTFEKAGTVTVKAEVKNG